MTKIAIVAPCHIPPSEAWIHALKSEADFNKAQVIIVDDSDGNLGELPKGWQVFGYERQRAFLDDLYPEFDRMFHKSSACRVFGHLWAYSEGFDIVIGLDSDCIVERGFVKDHVAFMGKDFGCGWFNPIGYPNYSRGYPYSQRKWSIVANMGLWKNVLDINGKDRASDEPKEIRVIGNTVPTGFFPFSGMNFALTRNVLLYFPFLPNFENSEGDKFRRIDDVWGGYIFEKFMQKKKSACMLGFPFVFHDTVVVAEEDAAEEAAMYKWEDEFIKSVDFAFAQMKNEDIGVAWELQEFADAFRGTHVAFRKLYPALDWWAAALKKYA